MDDIESYIKSTEREIKSNKEGMYKYKVFKWIGITEIAMYGLLQSLKISCGMPPDAHLISSPEGIETLIFCLLTPLCHYIENHDKEEMKDATHHKNRLEAGFEYQEKCRREGKPVDKSELERIVYN